MINCNTYFYNIFRTLASGLILLSLVFAKLSVAQTNEQLALNAKAYVTQCHRELVCNGSYLLIHNGTTVYQDSVGLSGRNAKDKLRESNAFDLGSLGKHFTAVAIMRLKDKGLLEFDDALVKFLPELNFKDVTLRHLLTNTSGMPDVMSYVSTLYRAGKVKYPVTNQTVISALITEQMQLQFVPGEKWQYSNTGYSLLASVVERVSGMPFSEFMQLEFFGPLGMKSSSVYKVNNSPVFDANRAFGFRLNYDRTISKNDQIPLLHIVGPGGIYANSSDLALWVKAMIENSIISKSSWQQAITAVTLNNGERYPYGFGLSLKPAITGKQRVGHFGHWRGFKTALEFYPESNHAVVILTNNSSDDTVDESVRAFEQMLAGEKFEFAKKAIGLAFVEYIENSGYEHTKSHFDSIDSIKNAYFVEEHDLNNVGYFFVQQDRLPEAILALTINNQLYPDSANTYDSLAEAQALNGNVEQAIKLIEYVGKAFPDFYDVNERLVEIKAIQRN